LNADLDDDEESEEDDDYVPDKKIMEATNKEISK
jgi:hypothetical protein